MSARDGPSGATNRSDLFVSAQRSGRQSNEKEGSNDRDNFPVLEDEDDQNPLQIEHVMGYAGDFRQTVLALNGDENVYIKSLGCLVLVENLMDPHDQKLLRGHDMEISALCQSPSGSMIASGQVGTKSFKGYAAPIFIWRNIGGSYRRVMVLRGLSVRVNLISISPDEKFLCGCGEDSLLYIWDLANGEVVFGQRVSSVVSVLQWADHRRVRQYDEYDIILGHGSLIWGGVFSFAPDRVQWSLKQTAFIMPPGGNMVRTFTALDLSNDGVFLYVGTSGGEMLVFRRDTCVFRACIPICSGGVNAIVTLSDSIICAGGDSSICKLDGRDMTWHMSQKVKLDSGVKALSLSANQSELIVGCSSGSVYRCLLRSLSSHIVAEGHTSPVTCVAFSSQQGAESNTMFATGTQSGELRLWDLTDYACTAVCGYPKSGSVLCLSLINTEMVVSGWADGFIRCHDTKTLETQLWYIANAHRDGVTSLSAHFDHNLQYLASGGGDGAVRVWRLGSRELVTQYTEHSKPVAKVLIDNRSPNIIHSVGRDSSLLSYDMKASRRIISHLLSSSSGSNSSGGTMTGMTQRIDSEQELITCDTQGRLLHWDIDYREPVMCVQDPDRSALHCCQVSPSGRYIAIAGDDQLLKVMELSSGQVLALGQGHSSAVKAVTWTPDEKQLITGGNDMSLCVWNWYLGDIKEGNGRSPPQSRGGEAKMSDRGGRGDKGKEEDRGGRGDRGKEEDRGGGGDRGRESDRGGGGDRGRESDRGGGGDRGRESDRGREGAQSGRRY